MKNKTPRAPFRLLALCAALALPGVAAAQEGAETSGGRVFTPEDFARFAPTNAMDMLNQVPGFSVRNDDDQGRGLGQASTNVLINGERVASKGQGVTDQLSRITAENVIRIEIVDGATMQIPGLSGQVANVITKSGDISGRYQYRTIHRPKYAQPNWWSGDLSVAGSSPGFEWNAAYNHGNGRGASGGGGWLTDGTGNVTEFRDVRQHFEGEFPRLSGSLKWTSEGGTIANFNAIYNQSENANSNDEVRDPVTGVGGYFRDSGNGSKGHGYEIGGDVDFKFGPGRLKLIAMDRGNENKSRQLTLNIFDDGAPTTGSRFAGENETGETIGRAEYRWDAWGGNWQLDGEAAFNDLEQGSRLFTYANGGFTEIPLPRGSGEVSEDRYEVILTHGRMFGNGVSMQLGVGAENSELAQSGPSGLTREFWRPKGSLTLGWTPHDGLDLSLKIARTVGQLSFGDFLASVSLQQNTANAGNAQLKPTLSWTSDLEIKQNLGAWGSTTLTLYGKWHDDYIESIPIATGGESPGNIDNARVYGFTWTNTINLDPMGWTGTKLNVNITMEDSEVEDPLTRLNRSFSNHYDRRANANIRRDIPNSNWAWGFGIEYTHALPYYRLNEIGKNYEGPAYTFAFIERKNVYGMTVNFNVFNMTDGRYMSHRTVYTDRRDNSPVSFTENYDLSVQPIFRLQVTGNF